MHYKEIAMNRIRFHALGLALSLLTALPAVADQLLVDSVAAGASVATPGRGMTMEQVRQQFGAAQSEQPTVSANGGPHQPPITRWDYAGYSVFFENDHVVHSVVHHAAAK
jgi:hypothetical protein